MKLQKNIGPWGRIGRALIGLILLVFAYLEQSWLLLFFSVFTFFEACFSWCVLYQILGINRCSVKNKK